MPWRWVVGGVALVVTLIYALGWLVVSGDERRAYGWVALIAGLAAYWVTPWGQIQALGH